MRRDTPSRGALPPAPPAAAPSRSTAGRQALAATLFVAFRHERCRCIPCPATAENTAGPVHSVMASGGHPRPSLIL